MRDSPYQEGQRIARTGDSLSELDRAIVGDRGKQLRFEFRDQIYLRTLAEIFRDFANRLEVLSQPKRFTEREALLMAKEERKVAQRRLAPRQNIR